MAGVNDAKCFAQVTGVHHTSAMKRLIVGFALLGFVTSALAVNKAELDERTRRLTFKFAEMQQNLDKQIPAETLRHAQGIVLLDRTKAGFVFGFQGGSGVVMVRNPKSKGWSPVAFVEANEASLGPQIGVQQSFIVILLMTTNAAGMVTKPTFEFGGEARGTAGNSSAGLAAIITSQEQAMLVYEVRKGLFGGAVLKGGALSPDSEANLAYYGEAVTTRDIVFDQKVKSTESGTELARKIAEAESSVAAANTPPTPREVRPVKLESPKMMAEAKPERGAIIAAQGAAQGDAASEQLRLLLLDLDANHQTNAVKHLYGYLSTMITSQQTADLNSTILVLDRLRAGRVPEAIELLESRMDGALINLGATVGATPREERGSNSLATLQRAKEYRAKFPRKTGDRTIDQRVERAWSLPDEQK